MSAISKNLIVKNTLFLYLRSIVVLAITLFTTRFVLSALGAESFGVFQLIGGVISALTFICSSMTNATQRFLAYEIGLENQGRIQNVFVSIINIHILLSILIFVIMEVVGYIFIQCYLDIGSVKQSSALLVLLFSSLSFSISICSVPYSSLIIAKEDMSFFAYIDIIGTVLKFLSSLFLFIISKNRLEIYAGSLLVISFLIQIAYMLLCRFLYPGLKYKFGWNSKLIKKMLSFSGWTSLASFTFMARNQGLSILLNAFFGPIFNASVGIANQINSAVRTFSVNFQTSFSPQIVKTYAQDDYTHMNKLIYSGAKISTYLLFFFSLPIIFETDFILNLWLGRIPTYASVLVKLILLENILHTMTCTGNQAIRATGNVKYFEIIYNLTELLAFPFIIVYLHFDQNYYYPYIILLSFVFLSNFIKIFFLKKQIPSFKAWEYIKKVVLANLLIILASYFISEAIKLIWPMGLLRFFITFTSINVFICAIAYWIGLDSYEKQMVAKFKAKIKMKFIR